GLNLNVVINDEVIENVEEIKYLGLILDRELKFNKHNGYMSKKIGKKIGFMKRVSLFLSISTRQTIYNTLILPLFYYCSTIIYTGCSSFDRLQILQNKAMRAILGCNSFTSSHLMLEALNWIKIEHLLYIQMMIFIYKIVNMLPKYLNCQLVPVANIHGRNTRTTNSINFYVNSSNKTSSMKSLFHKG
ncbi:unnamed protein product, partial [Psylliodes chrysocephalus]